MKNIFFNYKSQNAFDHQSSVLKNVSKFDQNSKKSDILKSSTTAFLKANLKGYSSDHEFSNYIFYTNWSKSKSLQNYLDFQSFECYNYNCKISNPHNSIFSPFQFIIIIRCISLLDNAPNQVLVGCIIQKRTCHFADAEGKICPHTLRRMPSGMPCSFGSKALFSSEEIRDEASATYHKYEYK